MKVKIVSAFLEILKTFQVIKNRKCYFGALTVNYKQSGLSKKSDTVLNCK